MSKMGKFSMFLDITVGLLFLIHSIRSFINGQYYIGLLEGLVFLNNGRFLLTEYVWRTENRYLNQYK